MKIYIFSALAFSIGFLFAHIRMCRIIRKNGGLLYAVLANAISYACISDFQHIKGKIPVEIFVSENRIKDAKCSKIQTIVGWSPGSSPG